MESKTKKQRRFNIEDSNSFCEGFKYLLLDVGLLDPEYNGAESLLLLSIKN